MHAEEDLTAALPGPQGGPSSQSQECTGMKSPAEGAMRKMGLPAESHSRTFARKHRPPHQHRHLRDACPSGFIRLPSLKTSSGPAKGCCVLSCPSNESNMTDGLWLFPVPSQQTEPMHHAAWTKRIPIDLERSKPDSPYVCFHHFRSFDFVYRDGHPIGIRDDVMPSVSASEVQLGDLLPKSQGSDAFNLQCVALVKKARAAYYKSKRAEASARRATSATGGSKRVVPPGSSVPSEKEHHENSCRHAVIKKEPSKLDMPSGSFVPPENEHHENSCNHPVIEKEPSELDMPSGSFVPLENEHPKNNSGHLVVKKEPSQLEMPSGSFVPSEKEHHGNSCRHPVIKKEPSKLGMPSGSFVPPENEHHKNSYRHPVVKKEPGQLEMPTGLFMPSENEHHKNRHLVVKKEASQSETPAGESSASSLCASGKTGDGGQAVPFGCCVGAVNESHRRGPGHQSLQEPDSAPVGTLSTPAEGAESMGSTSKGSTEPSEQEQAVLFHPSMGNYVIEKKVLGEEGSNLDDAPIFFKISWAPQ
ncbi:hypothetical protein HPB48_001499 [Haemaphysalis longicornis]|uniref:THAP-type domain-containing protein n=1 Tax=Haemaphysalis longicornis TaxID=44386 RepID=A0A9J6F7B0_HAELO|nr:hypothetical protein HPB48_001499 [Haemaphysalis longicornis]